MHFSVAKRNKIENYSLILHSEFKLLEESQPMEKVCANRERDSTYCDLISLYLFSFLAHKQFVVLKGYTLFVLTSLFIPISINDVCNDAVNHIIKEGLAQETIVMGYDIFYIEHAHDVGHEIGCF